MNADEHEGARMNAETTRPPAAALRLLAAVAPARWGRSVAGDVEEEWTRRAHRCGAVRNWAWCWMVTLGIALRLAPLRFAGREEASSGVEDSRWGKGAGMGTWWQDFQFGMRTLRKSPGFALLAIVTLAVGIGLNTAMFSMVNGLLLQPFPFDDLDRIVSVAERDPTSHSGVSTTSPAAFLDWRARSTSFQAMAAYQFTSANLSGVEIPERVMGYLVSPELFSIVGVQALYGRTFLPEEQQPGKNEVVLLNYDFWWKRFGGDPDILGRTLVLNGVQRTVVGIMPHDYDFPSGADVWLPLSFSPALAANRTARFLPVIAKLKPGVTLAQAQSEMESLAAALEKEFPRREPGTGVAVQNLLDSTVRFYRPIILLLLAAVSFVLLMAVSNVAHLTLARAATRQREIAVRVALGASRGRIVRQLLLESLPLALAGGALGVLLGNWALGALIAATPANHTRFVPGFRYIGLDETVLLYALGVSLVCCLLVAASPARRAGRVDLNEALKEGSGNQMGVGRGRGRNALVVVEIVLSLVLLVAAGLMMRSFVGVMDVEPGFEVDNVVTMMLTLPANKYSTPEQRGRFIDDLLERTSALPGVQAAGATSHLPLSGGGERQRFMVEGRPPEGMESGQLPVVTQAAVTPGYFGALGIRLLGGREFTRQDAAGALPVVIVSEQMAAQQWPGEDAVGRRIIVDGDSTVLTVVGVVSNIRIRMTDTPTPMMYIPMAQSPRSTMTVVLRAPAGSSNDLPRLTAAVRDLAVGIDPDQPVYLVRTMEEVRLESVILLRNLAMQFGAFGIVAVILAAAGVYGVMAYSVSRRSYEMGVRMALGAQPGDVVRQVVREGMVPALIGVPIGLAAAFGVARLIGNFLVGVGPADPLTYAGVTVLLLSVALVACWIPARRASRVDPLVALRYE